MSNNIFSYTKRDYESSRKEGLSQIPKLSNGRWTDLNVSDPGIIILDYVHALVDMVNFYQDHQALEAFITTAKERSNIFRLAKQLSYKVRSAKGSKVVVTFHSDFAYEHVIKIPKYTKLYTYNDINFYTAEDAYLEPGASEVSVLCEQGTIHTHTYHGTGLSRLSSVEPPSNVNQSVTLTSENIDTESISIKDNLGRIWHPVDFIAFATEIDRVYQVDLNTDDTVTIRFGDGERGIVPSAEDKLIITYASTKADEGKISAFAIRGSAPIYDEYGKYIDLKVYNEEESVGGYSSQSSREITELAPGAIKAADRAVTLSDFENLARLNPGVRDAIAYDINTDSDIPYHEVKVLILPENIDIDESTNQNQILVDEVYNYLYQRMIPPTTLRVQVPTDIKVDIEVTVKSMNVDRERVMYDVQEVIKDYFNTLAYNIGSSFYPTDLAALIRSIPTINTVVSVIATPIDVDESDNVHINNLDKSISIPKFSRVKLNKTPLINVE